MSPRRFNLSPYHPVFALLCLLALSADPARAEDMASPPERAPRIPAVDTSAEDLAVLQRARLEGLQPIRSRPDAGATAAADRGLPPARPTGRAMPEAEHPGATQLLERFAAKAQVDDTAGGDDLLVLTSPSIRSYEMEITESGDIYLAVAHVPEGSPVRIDVFLSEDGGNSWALWGSRASGNYHYDWPSLHVAEGPNARVFLAYVFYEDGEEPSDLSGVIVASSVPEEADWNLTLSFYILDSQFRAPDITTDHENWNNYRVYLAAHEYDAEESSDIWFGVSDDFGESFESYEIGTLSVDGAHYWSPSISVGWGGVVHVAWYLYFSDFQSPYSSAIRYRRVTNRALGGLGSWDATLAITSTNDPNDHLIASVAAQATNGRVVINYSRLPQGGFENVVRSSLDSGQNWPASYEWSLEGPYLSQVGADAGRFYYTGDRFPNTSYGFTMVAETHPGRPSKTEILADDSYSSLINTPGSEAHPDPSRGNRFAVLWVDDNGATGEDDQLYIDAEWRGDPGYPNHHDAFPLPLAAAPVTPPAIVDVDADGLWKEIVFADENGMVHAIDGSSSELPGFPVSTHQSIADESLAVGDLDGDGLQEIIVGTTNGRVFAFAFDGSAVPGWPVSLPSKADAYVSMGTVSRLAARDVVVACGRKIHLLRPDGSEHSYASFPIASPEELHAAVAIGDLEADGRVEIVAVGGQNLRVYDAYAQPVFVQTIVGSDLRNTASLGDLDYDGTLEIVVPTDLGEVWVFEHHGGVRPGWPYDIGEVDIIQEVALADFAVNFEIELDLAFAQRGSRVHARSASGLAISGWPNDTSPGWFLYGGPIVAGLNEATDSEITIGDRGNLVHGWLGWIFDMTGWPKDVGAKVNLSPAAGDVDGDGLNDLVVLTDTEVVVLDVDGTPVADPTRIWPMYGYDPQRTSCGACAVDVATAVDPVVGGASLLSFAPPSPNPSGSRTQFSYRLPARAVVQLDVFDARGRLVRRVLKEEQGSGQHRVAWDGRDGYGNDVGNGQYFGRLSVAGEGFSEQMARKIVLLR